MNVEIIHDLKKEQDWVAVNGDYDQFHVYGDNEDYVEDTIGLMQKAATKCFKYPFYVHFEGYDDQVDSVLLHQDILDIYYQTSGRSVLTMSGGKTYHAAIPSFTVKIPNYESLKNVFNHWFHYAQENNMWLITQGFRLDYINKFAALETNNEPIVLVADHDAQSFSFIASHPSYRKKESLQLIFED